MGVLKQAVIQKVEYDFKVVDSHVDASKISPRSHALPAPQVPPSAQRQEVKRVLSGFVETQSGHFWFWCWLQMCCTPVRNSHRGAR